MTSRGFDYSSYPQVYGELFRAVQEERLFQDTKLFVDAEPLFHADLLLERYLSMRDGTTFEIESFVDEHFRLPEPIAENPELAPSLTMEEHVDALWEPLTRSFDVDPDSGTTLLPLPNPHVVPGGRFREMYYWDSYFTAEGLAVCDRLELVEGMVENVASLLDRYQFVPLGNRVYYDSRSQVPLFYRMLRILERERDLDAVEPYLGALETEYAFWMDGSTRIEGVDDVEEQPPSARSHRRVVTVPDGTVLNRYWDDRARPRPESYWVDRQVASDIPTDERPQLFRDIRAACESGWDFSTRWLADEDDLSSIHTTELVPVDLNAILFGMENALSEWLRRTGKPEAGERYAAAANRRREAVERYCWDDDAEFYVDYWWPESEPTNRHTLAGVVPLFTGLADQDRADAVAEHLQKAFLRDGGLLTSLSASGEQWDAPNGWAPLHWMAVQGLHRYDHDDLAEDITRRWLEMNRAAFEESGRMAEKYDVERASMADDTGEYPLQYGFGWTNGVVAALQETAH